MTGADLDRIERSLPTPFCEPEVEEAFRRQAPQYVRSLLDDLRRLRRALYIDRLEADPMDQEAHRRLAALFNLRNLGDCLRDGTVKMAPPAVEKP